MAYPRIKELREQHDFTQQNVADKLNLPLATYRSYETGAREPGIETLMLLSELYDVTVDYLLDHKPKPALISSDEFKKVKKYRELDEYGKKAVNLLLDVEYERCTKQKMIKSFRAASSVDNHEPEIDISEYTRNIAAGTGNEGFDDNKINEVNDFARQIAELENKSE